MYGGAPGMPKDDNVVPLALVVEVLHGILALHREAAVQPKVEVIARRHLPPETLGDLCLQTWLQGIETGRKILIGKDMAVIGNRL
jgi:hypothetical protein